MAAFISHCAKDAPFVRLLVRMLEFHGIEYWYSASSLQAGDKFADEINLALSKSTILLVVVSSHSSASSWVFDEVNAFRRLHPANRIVPLIIDSAGLESLPRFGLFDIQRIHFDDCLLHGFECLFSVFGQQFLQQRKVRPRTNSDRRKTPTRQRMRMGLWKRFHLATRLGQMEYVDDSYSKMMLLSEVCIQEAFCYHFSSKADGTSVDPAQAASDAVREVWSGLKGSPMRAVYLTEAVSELIWERFTLRPVDRRSDVKSLQAGTAEGR